MSRTAWIAIACVLGAGLAAPVMAAPADAAAALQPTEAEEKAYYDLSGEGLKAVSKAQGVWIDEMRGKSDPDKLCKLTGDMHKAYAQSTQALMEYLLRLRAEGKSIDRFMGSWLDRSKGMDEARIRELERCSEAEAKRRGLDDEQEIGLFIGKIDAELVTVERGYAAAKAGGNPIAEAGHIQTQDIYLKEMIENAEILRDYGEGDHKALVAKIPAWEAKRTGVGVLMAQKVYIHTDPDNARNKPYVFTPFVMPPMPANDEAFDKAVTSMISSATGPMLEAMRKAMAGDTAGFCAQTRNALSELQRTRGFVTAYIDAQAAKGTPTDRGPVVLPKIDEMINKLQSTMTLKCVGV